MRWERGGALAHMNFPPGQSPGSLGEDALSQLQGIRDSGQKKKLVEFTANTTQL